MQAAHDRSIRSHFGVLILCLPAVIRKPLFKCFIHMLREVNPQVAANIESSPTSPSAAKGKSKKASKYINKVKRFPAIKFMRVARLC